MNREKALEDYYSNPSLCKNCGKIIQVPEGGRIYDTKRKKFCDSSCSASFNNKGKIRNPNGINGIDLIKIDQEIVIKTPKENIDKICPQCGGRKTKKAKLCSNCYSTNRSVSNKTLGNYISGKNYLSSKIVDIRRDARRIMNNSNKEKICIFCNNHDFDEILEVHHIKGILEFEETSLISEINNEENLM